MNEVFYSKRSCTCEHCGLETRISKKPKRIPKYEKWNCKDCEYGTRISGFALSENMVKEKIAEHYNGSTLERIEKGGKYYYRILNLEDLYLYKSYQLYCKYYNQFRKDRKYRYFPNQVSVFIDCPKAINSTDFRSNCTSIKKQNRKRDSS